MNMKGKVIDRENGAFLANVHVINLKDSTLTITNQLGEFTLNQPGSYKFTRIGYESKF